ncbi:MAG: metalloprotease PmbA [Burkholderiales bacterium]|jgi:PmbA protein|nr:metalloprotease PmbA [Burkholderiales bacterium]
MAFSLSDDQLRALALDALDHARALGATDAAAEVSESTGLSVTTRKMKVETIEHTRDKSLGVSVYLGQRRGHASTSDFSPAALRQAVEAAYTIARFTAEDLAAGLPDEDMLEHAPRDLDLYHPWALATEQAIELAQACEQAAFDTDRRIVNSEGANVYASAAHFVLANTRGFCAGFPSSRHSISVSPIARDQGGMQRDDWYTHSRRADGLAAPEAVGRYAAERALARLSARKLSTRRCPVLFEAPLACGLIGSLVGAASGGALYRKASFLVDALGQKFFADHISLRDDPFVPQASGSSPFDEEGVRGQARDVIEAGVLTGYFLGSYSARKLGLKTTGNAGGAHNLTLHSTRTQPGDDFRAMLRKLGTGLLVTELIGSGVNTVTGDYSRGASGFWVQGGAIAYPVEEITVAGNLKSMYANLVAVGADRVVRGGRVAGSVIVEGMTVGGA